MSYGHWGILDMSSEEEPCCKCGQEIDDAHIIYIREQVNGKWGNHPICTPCWYKANPGRTPHRVTWNEDDD